MAGERQPDASPADAQAQRLHAGASPADLSHSDASLADASLADASLADAAPRSSEDARRELVRLWGVTGALLVGLGAVAFFLGGTTVEHARLGVSLEHGARGDGARPEEDSREDGGALDEEALAYTVAFSDAFRLDETRTVSVETHAAHPRTAERGAAEHDETERAASAASGTLVVSLVELATDRTREVVVELGETAYFARVAPSEYVVRLTGDGRGRALGVVRSGGIAWPTTALAALLLVAPALWRSFRGRRP